MRQKITTSFYLTHRPKTYEGPVYENFDGLWVAQKKGPPTPLVGVGGIVRVSITSKLPWWQLRRRHRETHYDTSKATGEARKGRVRTSADQFRPAHELFELIMSNEARHYGVKPPT